MLRLTDVVIRTNNNIGVGNAITRYIYVKAERIRFYVLRLFRQISFFTTPLGLSICASRKCERGSQKNTKTNESLSHFCHLPKSMSVNADLIKHNFFFFFNLYSNYYYRHPSKDGTNTKIYCLKSICECVELFFTHLSMTFT